MNTVRCAVYTRKSSEEGLEQDFNSLDAQREACAAYVLSQASEGWKLIPEHYDDGGISGGTLERPALQRLLKDIAAGRIDIIVVYKVDRLTRALLDFSKLVEVFDEAGVSFVSVTQSFNTTTSMGRLTLNMLLSFAQFEREVTAERIRDKLAASKAKGMWMGGTPPLGYKPAGRSLEIVEEHAAIVRDIYDRYLDLKNVRSVAEALVRDKITAPHRTTASGRAYGGCAFTRGQLYFLLKNPVYAGDIAHKDKIYPGNHPPIIERQMWDAVQRQLAEHVQGTAATREKNASMLAGLLFDAEGEPLIAVHTNKGTQRYRYYVSKAQHHRLGDAGASAMRLPAGEIEQVVRRELQALFGDPLGMLSKFEIELAPSQLRAISERGAKVSAALERPKASTVRTIVQRVEVHPERIGIAFQPAGLAEALGVEIAQTDPPLVHQAAIRLTKTGRAVRLVHEHAPPTPQPSASLIDLVARARKWWGELCLGEIDIATLARREGVNDSYMTRIVRLAFLNPAVVEAGLDGALRQGVGGKALLALGVASADWKDQQGAFL